MSSAQPKQLISCYDDLGFEQHEWGKHGVCAGVKDAKDFFTQVCALSAAPLSVMAATVAAGGDVARAAADLKAAGYALFGTDAKNSQVELSACADASGTWHLAAISDFDATCEAASFRQPYPQLYPNPDPKPKQVRSRAGTHTLTRGALPARAAWAAVQDRRRLRPRPGLPPLRALGLLLRGAGAGSRHGGRRRGLNGHVSRVLCCLRTVTRVYKCSLLQATSSDHAFECYLCGVVVVRI